MCLDGGRPLLRMTASPSLWHTPNVCKRRAGPHPHTFGLSERITRFTTGRFRPHDSPWSHKAVSLNGHLGNSEIGGFKEIRQPFANPSPTLCQPFVNPLPTFRQPFANLFCQPLSNPLFPWAPGTRLETRVNGFFDEGPQNSPYEGQFCGKTDRGGGLS